MGDVIQFPPDENEVEVTDDDDGKSLLSALGVLANGRPLDNVLNAIVNLTAAVIITNFKERAHEATAKKIARAVRKSIASQAGDKRHDVH